VSAIRARFARCATCSLVMSGMGLRRSGRGTPTSLLAGPDARGQRAARSRRAGGTRTVSGLPSPAERAVLARWVGGPLPPSGRYLHRYGPRGAGTARSRGRPPAFRVGCLARSHRRRPLPSPGGRNRQHGDRPSRRIRPLTDRCAPGRHRSRERAKPAARRPAIAQDPPAHGSMCPRTAPFPRAGETGSVHGHPDALPARSRIGAASETRRLRERAIPAARPSGTPHGTPARGPGSSHSQRSSSRGSSRGNSSPAPGPGPGPGPDPDPDPDPDRAGTAPRPAPARIGRHPASGRNRLEARHPPAGPAPDLQAVTSRSRTRTSGAGSQAPQVTRPPPTGPPSRRAPRGACGHRHAAGDRRTAPRDTARCRETPARDRKPAPPGRHHRAGPRRYFPDPAVPGPAAPAPPGCPAPDPPAPPAPDPPDAA